MRMYARLLGVLLGLVPSVALGQSYMNFETAPTRPVALSPDGSTLFVTNTPDNRLEIFDVSSGDPVHTASVPVGLEPVAVAARTNTEVWVVNYLSDSVSVVDAGASPPRVVRTLLVGDEPSDVVVGGTRAEPTDPFPRVFVSAARRGQNHVDFPNPKADLLTEGVNRADVWIFDGTNPGSGLSGAPTIVQVFGDKPRPLAVSDDGSEVYVGIWHSGNRSTTIFEGAVCNGGAGAGSCGLPNGGSAPGGLPAPNVDASANPQPEVGLIVQFNPTSGNWEDPLARDWSDAVPFSLPDQDVFAIGGDLPHSVTPYATVGTVLFGMSVGPDGKVWVANTNANNLERFEGPGFAGSGSLRGHLAESQVTLIDPDAQPQATIEARHLNKHIIYGPGATTFDAGGDKGDSLATPTAVAFSGDGNTAYVAGFGSAKIATYPRAAVENDTFFPDGADDILLSGGGPSGMVVSGSRMYAYTRLDNALKTIDLGTGTEIGSDPLHDVEPPVVTDGRRFLYDADFTSGNGEASCSSCHIFGNLDGLAWDLGDPSGSEVGNPNPFKVGSGQPFHPLKGPMTTQTLRGMANHGPMHWRGDRTAPGQALNEQLAFEEFNPAFDGLLGRDAGQLDTADMTAFAQFALTIMMPPNPHRRFDNQLCTAADVGVNPLCFDDEDAGDDLYHTVQTDAGVLQCQFCHVVDQTRRGAGGPPNGFFGGDGTSTIEGETQEFKIPHLRNMYDKVGMFGTTIGQLAPNALGDQVRGFGYLHDGSVATLFDFVSSAVFQNLTTDQRLDIVSFMFVFESNLAPVVGQQVTLTAANGGTAGPRIDELRAAAQRDFSMVEVAGAKECELVVKGVIGSDARGWVMDPGTGDYTDDQGNTINDTDLRNLANTAGQELTFTCAYPSGGDRIGVDRDDDGIDDGQQCGDVTDDGLVAAADPEALAQQLAALGAVAAPDKCNVIGANGSSPAECDVADLAALLRDNAGLGPGLGQGCTL